MIFYIQVSSKVVFEYFIQAFEQMSNLMNENY